MSDSPKDFFDEVTKEINVSPQVTEDTGKTQDPLSSAETKIVASPPVKDIQIKIPPAMPDFSEAPKGPQGRVIQESSTPTRMAGPPPLPEVPSPPPVADTPDIDIDLSDEPRESIKTDYGARATDNNFKSLPRKNESPIDVGGSFQMIGLGLIVVILVGGVYYILKHRSPLAVETNSASSPTGNSTVNPSLAKTENSDANWQMNLNRSWLNFGPAPKTWKDFQKSVDQAMVDLGPVEH